MFVKIGPGRVSNAAVCGLYSDTPRMSDGSRSLVNCTRRKLSPSAAASARASVVLPTPGMSSNSTWPRASSAASANRTTSCLPWNTVSTAAIRSDGSPGAGLPGAAGTSRALPDIIRSGCGRGSGSGCECEIGNWERKRRGCHRNGAPLPQPLAHPLTLPLPSPSPFLLLVLALQLRDYGRVGERRRVAERTAFRDVAQQTPHDLARARLGQIGREQ